MAQQAAWESYIRAMQSHLACEERLRERLVIYVGNPPRVPVALTAAEARTWLGLVADVEEHASTHRARLETLVRELLGRSD